MTNQTDEILINVEESQNSRPFIEAEQDFDENKILFGKELKLAMGFISDLVKKIEDKVNKQKKINPKKTTFTSTIR